MYLAKHYCTTYNSPLWAGGMGNGEPLQALVSIRAATILATAERLSDCSHSVAALVI